MSLRTIRVEGDEILRNGSGAGWTGSTEELFQKILEEDG